MEKNSKRIVVVDDPTLVDINNIMSPEPYLIHSNELENSRLQKELNSFRYRNRPSVVLSPVRTEIKQQRNNKCLCGSGKKYKHCCL